MIWLEIFIYQKSLLNYWLQDYKRIYCWNSVQVSHFIETGKQNCVSTFFQMASLSIVLILKGYFSLWDFQLMIQGIVQRLFIDSSKRSLKCVLLHNGNKYGSVPVGHFIKLKEEYKTIKIVLARLQYNFVNL